jgi:hypothetical protein
VLSAVGMTSRLFSVPVIVPPVRFSALLASALKFALTCGASATVPLTNVFGT